MSETRRGKAKIWRFALGVGGPALLQALLVYLVIVRNTGNGSWLGLGALLLGLVAIPATAIVNVVLVLAWRGASAKRVVLACFAIGMVVPIFAALSLLL